MKRVALVAVILIITILLGCNPKTSVTPLPDREAPTTAPKTSESSSIPSPPKPAEFVIRDLTITPNEVISGASVTIKVTVINIGEQSGTYEVNLKIDNTIEGTAVVTLAGGANQNVTFRVTKWMARTYSVSIDGQSGNLMVKSPPPSPVVQPSPVSLPAMDAFMKGIHFNDWTTFDAPPIRWGQYATPRADQSLKNLAATGANWISLLVLGSQETVASTTIFRTQPRTATDSELLHVVKLAHSLGMRVALLPALYDFSNDPSHKWEEIGTAFTTETQWQEWFASYREFINHYASFAQDAGVDLFYVGSELGGVTDREDDWRRIVKEVRQRFNGQISYDSLGPTSKTFPFGEVLRIKWWDAVDYIATDVWYPLTNKNDPTVEELKEAWIKKGYLAELENLAKQFDKPFIISEIGYRSTDGTNKRPWDWQTAAPIDLQEQADCYQAALEVLWGKPWLKGIFWFQWRATVATPTSPQGKPAEEVIKKFYLSP